jgi:hypothetical protein
MYLLLDDFRKLLQLRSLCDAERRWMNTMNKSCLERRGSGYIKNNVPGMRTEIQRKIPRILVELETDTS